MTDDRDPYLANQLHQLTPPQHRPRFWDDLDDDLAGTGTTAGRSRRRADERWWMPSRSLLATAAALVVASATGLGLIIANQDNGTDLATGPAGSPGETTPAPPPSSDDEVTSNALGSDEADFDGGPVTTPPILPGDDPESSVATDPPTSASASTATTSPATTTAPTTTTTSTDGTGATCSAQTLGGASINSGQPWSSLAAEIQQAALACDYDRLADLAGPDFSYSFASSGDFAGYLREAEANGDDPTRKLVLLMERAPRETDYPEGPQHVIWPAFFACEAECGMDEDEVRRLGYSDDDIASFREFGGYGGYRAAFGVEAGGRYTWLYFTAGD